MLKKKKLVITGSEGLIGKKLVKYFKTKYEVIPLDIQLGHDLTDEEFVKKWFKANKHIYGVILCHAYNPIPKKNTKPVSPIEVPLDEIREFLNVNTVSLFSISRQFIKNNKGGVIITIGSIYGTRAPKHHIYKDFVKHIGYSISKAGMTMMSKYLATYYAPHFRINTVVLGGIADPKQEASFVKNYSDNTPLKRLMDIGEIIPVFELLLNKKSTSITGTEIYVDGGWTAW